MHVEPLSFLLGGVAGMLVLAVVALFGYARWITAKLDGREKTARPARGRRPGAVPQSPTLPLPGMPLSESEEPPNNFTHPQPIPIRRRPTMREYLHGLQQRDAAEVLEAMKK